MTITTIALDLEGTLIDNAMSGRPRPGLRDFLSFCNDRFQRICLFTTVEEEDACAVMLDLDHSRQLPPGLLFRFEYIKWTGEYKDLTFIPNATLEETLIVDDDGGWIRPDQRERWIAIAPWKGDADEELIRVREVLESR